MCHNKSVNAAYSHAYFLQFTYISILHITVFFFCTVQLRKVVRKKLSSNGCVHDAPPFARVPSSSASQEITTVSFLLFTVDTILSFHLVNFFLLFININPLECFVRLYEINTIKCKPSQMNKGNIIF